MKRLLTVAFVIAALLIGFLTVPAKADWMRTLSTITLTTTSGSVEITTGRFRSQMGTTHWRLVLQNATGFVGFLTALTDNQTMAATSVNRVYMPNNEMVQAISAPGPIISLLSITNATLVIQLVEPVR